MPDIDPGPEVFAPPPPPVAAAALSENAAGALAYITVLPAILFLVLEPYNRSAFVRFNAFQSIGLSVVAFCCSFLIAIPILGWLAGLLMMPVLILAWLVCILKASQGKPFSLPVIGPIVANLAK